MRPDYYRARNGLLLIAAQIGGGLVLGILVGFGVGRATAPVPSATPIATPAPYVIERDVVRCELGMTLQVVADADGRIVSWCE